MSAKPSSSSGSRRGRLLVILGVVAVALVGGALAAYEFRYEIVKQAYMSWPLDDRERIGAGDGFNILIVVLDACRADKVGTYGFDRNTTPVLDAFARDPDAVTFLNHYVQGNWTKPSTASLFTGLFPHEHGFVYGELNAQDENNELIFKRQALPPDFVTLAEALNDGGFYTFGVVSPIQLGSDYGLDQGFDEYLAPLVRGGTGDDLRLRMTTALVPEISGRFFGYVHFLGCHRAFPPEFRDAAYMSEYGFDYDEAARAEDGVIFSTIQPLDDMINEDGKELNDRDRDFLGLVYEARMRWTDRNLVDPLIQMLKDSGKYDNTLVIFTADHGEELTDHGGYGHGDDLWDELIHVPMIVKYPKGMKPEDLDSRVAALTSAIDVAPSLLSLAGLEPPEAMRGSAALVGAFTPYVLAEDASCTLANADTCHLTVDWTLIQDGFKLLEAAAGTYLFDRKKDPAEKVSLASEMPNKVEEMRSFVRQLRQDSSVPVAIPSIDTEMDEETLKSLRGLGYVQ